MLEKHKQKLLRLKISYQDHARLVQMRSVCTDSMVAWNIAWIRPLRLLNEGYKSTELLKQLGKKVEAILVGTS